MNLYKMKDSLSVSSYPRALYSIIVSVGLLAAFITFASWILLSYPISTEVGNYVSGINDIADVSSPASSQNAVPSEVNSIDKVIDRDGMDVNHENGSEKSAEEKSVDARIDAKTTPEINSQNPTPSEVNTSEKASAVKKDGGLDANHEGEDTTKAKEKPSEVSNSENTTKGAQISQDLQLRDAIIKIPSEVSNTENTTQGVMNSKDLRPVKDVGGVDVSQENKDKQIANDVKTDQPVSEDTKKIDIMDNNQPPPLEEECDLFHGEWYYDESGPLYTNKSCPIITQMQNCQGNGRPDKGYENWRWRPSHCELPRFNPHKFFELMRGKTLAFVGDSVARNQMESLMCMLWQVEVPKNRGNRHMQRWFFRSKSVMITRIWSSWLVHQTGAAFKDVPEGVAKVFLDIPDEKFMEHAPEFDVVVLSSGHWFAKQSIYIKNNEIVGTQLWSPPNGQQFQVNNVEAFGISVETAMTALATNPNFTGISILRSFSPDHYEGGAWNTGGSCTGKEEPARPGQLVENGFTNVMHEKQVAGFHRATKKQTNGSKLRLMDITEVFSYRHDGHPGPYRSPDPNKITKRGPDGRPPPQDCLHWCMPGPVDTWNELVLEIIRRVYER